MAAAGGLAASTSQSAGPSGLSLQISGSSSVTDVSLDTRAYISGDNLHLWTPYTGYDPEVHSQLPGIAPRGIDYLHYPRPRTITGGLRVAF